MTEIYVL